MEVRVTLQQCSFFFLSFIFLLIQANTSYAFNAKTRLDNTPPLPDDPCQTQPLRNWTPQEKWVWQQVCEGEIANFNKAEGYGGNLDPKKIEGWSNNRVLRPAFIETLLLHEPYRSVLSRQGIFIVGAWFKETLDLSNAAITKEVSLVSSKFESDVNLINLQSPQSIVLKGSVIAGTLFAMEMRIGRSLIIDRCKISKMNLLGSEIGADLSLVKSKVEGPLSADLIHVGRNIYMSDGKYSDKVSLSSIKIGGHLLMFESQFRGQLILFASKVQGDIFMTKIRFVTMDLRNIKIGGSLNMMDINELDDRVPTNVYLARAEIGSRLLLNGAMLTGKLTMDSLEVKDDLLMRSGEFHEVNLAGAKIWGNLEMDGSKFHGELQMESLQVVRNLFMREKAQYFAAVNLRGAKIGGQIDTSAGIFNDRLGLNSIYVESSLFMIKGEYLSDVNMVSANIKGALLMSEAKFKKNLFMSGLNVDLLNMNNGEFVKVSLNSAEIGSQINMIGAKFTGALFMNAIDVKGPLLMRDAEFMEVNLDSAKIEGNLELVNSKFRKRLNKEGNTTDNLGQRDSQAVNLRGAKISGQLNFNKSKFDGGLLMDQLHVGRNLYMRYVTYDTGSSEYITLTHATIGDNLDLSGSTLGSFDMTGTSIGGELAFGIPVTQWLKGARLSLRNTKLGVLLDTSDSWPDHLELDGFTYASLGTFSEEQSEDFMAQGNLWRIEEWLAKQEIYSPQPYEHLAYILRKTGFESEATDILYAGRERERFGTTIKTKWLWLTMLKYVIGYGYRTYYSTFWIILFLTTGAVVISQNKEGKKRSFLWCLFFSLDILLPIIKLDQRHYDIRLEGFARYYIYFHTLTGFLLVSFLLAGISGLTK